MRRYVVTGAPGAGKSTLLAALRGRGYAVVGEAATDVLTRARARGRAHPVPDPQLLEAIARLQRRRERRPPPVGAGVQLYDRSPICTLALARYLGLPVPPVLAGEVERVVAAGVYQRAVFFVHLLGFVTPTAVRRITLAQSVAFERFHTDAYRQLGFALVDVPAAPVAERADLVERYLAGLGGSDRA